MDLDRRFWWGLSFGSLGALLVGYGVSRDLFLTLLCVGFYVFASLIAKIWLK